MGIRTWLGSGDRSRLAILAAIETTAVASGFVLASWYWAIEEHIVYFLVFSLASAVVIYKRPGLTVSKNSLAPVVFFIGLMTWIGVSTFWSDTFHLSLSYAVLVIAVGLTALAMGIAFRLEIVLAGLAVGMGLVIAHGVARAYLGGANLETYLAILDDDPNFLGLPWGLFTNPSGLSALTAVGILATVFSLSSKKWVSGLAAFFGGALAYCFLVLEILAPIFAIATAFLVAGALWHVRRSSVTIKRILSFAYPSAFLLSGLVFWFFREPILKPLGERPDLSGRLIVWDWYFEAFLWRPFFGTGWGSSRGAPPLAEERTVPVKEWFLAHNGYIDLAIMLGMVGFILLAGTLVSLAVVGARRSVHSNYSFRWAFVPVLIVYLSVNDLMSSMLPRFVGFFLLGIMVGLLLRRDRSSREDLSALRTA